jgi:hypothetical protein
MKTKRHIGRNGRKEGRQVIKKKKDKEGRKEK